ncbi:Pyruvate carboxylase [Wickerhamiella sorbophila]|uniref:Pyruvate carboxylase n=1 Tax=Wickerhamiella sorbophila TaxID=45607 RepID=A0A2T0FJZ2_9ASCO|nr:Pyruvate carboxylase [Wickerhamiella sorbophila]PRT55287.1 Pyruvate carboxylase [Wickerhamiella sorbophila]
MDDVAFTELPSLETVRAGTSILGPNNKILVANRSEIAVRVFRTAHELSMVTVGIYAHEDMLSMHRLKADEAYVIGKPGQFTPVGAYLQIDEIIKIAKLHNVNMIHPGYGFLSENSEFARKVIEAGIIWVGPPPEVIDSVGDKVSARYLADRAGVPTVPGTPGPIDNVEQARAFVAEHGFPVIIKAAFGGGGRGMRVVREGEDIEDAFIRATSEAKTAFGNGTVFIERFLDKPKHIEVQLLADGEGNVIHLFERDCSVQRRHQKVVEIAPAVSLNEGVRNAILADAVKLAQVAGYKNAGTAEFLVDNQNRHYFIEINPRIQVEHTITEEITGIDIVAAQIQIAAGATLEDLGLQQDNITIRGCAIQCRITTEDASKNFQPDTGRVEVYRSAGGNGVRLDGGNGFAGAVITPYYDSLLVKCTCLGSNFETARRKTLRSLIEFRVRGVKTNIPFLLSLITHPTFIANQCWTTFIDDEPSLFQLFKFQNRAHRILAFLADVLVNGSSLVGQRGLPSLKSPVQVPSLTGIPDVSVKPQNGLRYLLLNEGPEAVAKAVRNFDGTMIMDTTWRDAHQSLLATRLRTYDLLKIAPTTAHALEGAFALECWGGATFDVAMRFLHEDPWDRLRKLREAVPNVLFQMLLRGANGVAYASLPDNAIDHFVKQAKDAGVDVFRVFDALNDLEQLEVGVNAVKKAGGLVEATVCYSGDMLVPGKKYNLDYYLEVVRKIVAMGTHILGIKDMAGTLRPKAATLLIGSIRKEFPDLPIHVHTHDSAGTGVASMVACARAGADVVDAASNSMSGMTSQPSISALLASLDGEINTNLNGDHVREIDNYWMQMRLLYSPFDAELKGPDPEVYIHEIPGGQLTNLLFQAQQVGLGSQWEETKKTYTEANKLLGDIVKVTPTSKVVGDLAQFMVSNKLTPEDVERRASELDFPDSVLDFFQGLMGTPYGGFPEPLRTNILKGKRTPMNKRPGALLAPLDLEAMKRDLRARLGHDISETDLASYVMYPKVFESFHELRQRFGDLSVVPTDIFMAPLEIGKPYEIEITRGKVLVIKCLTVGDISSQTGTRDVYFELNGEMRNITVEDRNAAVETISRPKADPSNPGDIGAPMAGGVVEIRVEAGQEVKKGQPVLVLSAMKMEMVVSAPVAGKVSSVEVKGGDAVDGGDLLVKIIPL